MRYRILLILSLALLILPLVQPQYSWICALGIVLILLIRNRKQLLSYGKFFLPSVAFLILLYLLAGRWEQGLQSALLLLSSSLSFQLYFGFFRELSIYDLLLKTGFPRRISFVMYASLNYVSCIKPMIREIQDAQRLRGIEIKKGIGGLFHLPILLVPLMVRILKGTEHLAESLTLRNLED